MKRWKPLDRRSLVKDAQEYRDWRSASGSAPRAPGRRLDDAGRAVELAELAVLIAGFAPGEESWRWRLQGFAAAHRGNARRVGGDLPGADEAFRRALELLGGGPARRSGAAFRGAGSQPGGLFTHRSRPSAGSGGPSRPRAGGQSGSPAAKSSDPEGASPGSGRDYEGALAMLRQAGPLNAEQKNDRRLASMLRQNPALLLCHLGRYAEAEALLPEIRVLTMQLDNKLDSLRLRWLEGRVAAGLGRAEEALAALSQVRAGFGTRHRLRCRLGDAGAGGGAPGAGGAPARSRRWRGRWRRSSRRRESIAEPWQR